MPKRSAPSVRFMTDGSLRTEQGTRLVGGAALAPEDARDAARRLRVLVHHYGRPVEDITGDAVRLADALRDVRELLELFTYNAFIYAGDGAHEVLVLRWNH